MVSDIVIISMPFLRRRTTHNFYLSVVSDFSTLLPGVALSEATQAQRLLDDCSLSVTAIDTAENNPLNVFNSSQILGTKPEFDPDLGSPNEFCPGGGPGRGVGGVPNSTFRKWMLAAINHN
jgi:hypothetical protein